MKIAFIGGNLKYGGGKIVGLQTIKYLLKNQQKENIFALLPDDIEYKNKWVEYGGLENNAKWTEHYSVNIKYHLNINSWLKENNIDILYNATNIPIISPYCKQVILIQNAFLITPFYYYMKGYPKSLFIKIAAKKTGLKILGKNVDHWVVQSNFMRNNLIKNNKINSKNISVIASGCDIKYINKTRYKENKNTNEILIFCPTKLYPHKKLELLSSIIDHMKKESKKHFKFLLTLNNEE